MPCGDAAARHAVHVEHGHERGGRRNGREVGLEHDAVDVLLAAGERSVDREGAGEIAGIVRGALGTAVEEEHVARPEDVAVVVVVERLAVNGRDHREGQARTAGEGDLGDPGRDVGLAHPGPRHAHAGQLHVHGEIDGALDLGELLGGLHGALLRHRTDERHARLGRAACAQQVHQAELVLGSVRRQHVDAPPGRPRTRHAVGEGPRRRRVVQPPSRRQLRGGGLGPHPDDGVDAGIVGEDRGVSLVQVHDGREARTVDAEVVEERAVLSVRIRVVGVVAGALVVAQEQQQAALAGTGQGVPKRSPSVAVRRWCEHGTSRRDHMSRRGRGEGLDCRRGRLPSLVDTSQRSTHV